MIVLTMAAACFFCAGVPEQTNDVGSQSSFLSISSTHFPDPMQPIDWRPAALAIELSLVMATLSVSFKKSLPVMGLAAGAAAALGVAALGAAGAAAGAGAAAAFGAAALAAAMCFLALALAFLVAASAASTLASLALSASIFFSLASSGAGAAACSCAVGAFAPPPSPPTLLTMAREADCMTGRAGSCVGLGATALVDACLAACTLCAAAACTTFFASSTLAACDSPLSMPSSSFCSLPSICSCFTMIPSSRRTSAALIVTLPPFFSNSESAPASPAPNWSARPTSAMTAQTPARPAATRR
mmetsp:Transcript_36378/g.89521  ORF Transcript_36378/g.89521 Transcript_36378/m.89521 type:complete len:301 (-) Transcript_36378:49-951(-)